MKNLIVALLLVATASFSQSHVQCLQLETCKTRAFAQPPEFNLWAGSSLTQALVGESSDFQLNFGVSGKFILNYVKIGSAHVILYGNLAPGFSAKSASAFDAVSYANDGIGVGISPYVILGNLGLKSLTVIADVGAKNNDFGETSVWSYRLGGGLDGSLSAPGLGMPLSLSAKATYVVVRESTFNKVQAEVDGNYLVFDANFILPLKNRLGLLFQGETTLETAPIYRIGLVLGTSL